MALAAGQCFLMPVLLAAVGAVGAGPAQGGQIGGAVAGLIVGIWIAVVVTRFIIPSEERS